MYAILVYMQFFAILPRKKIDLSGQKQAPRYRVWNIVLGYFWLKTNILE